MVIPIIARELARRGAGYIAQALRAQDGLIKAAYTRPFISRNFNRGAVKGIQHGLGGGLVFSGYYRTSDMVNNEDPLTYDEEYQDSAKKNVKRYGVKTYSKRQAYCRQATRPSDRHSRRY